MATICTRTWLLNSSVLCTNYRRKHVPRASAVVQQQSRKCAPFLQRIQSTEEWTAVPDIWRSSAEKFGDRVALVDPHRDPPYKMTYVQLEESILNFAEAIRSLGVLPNEHVSLFADNSCRWLVADQGILAMGAINAVRGSRSSDEELIYILKHSDSVGLVIDNPELLKRLTPKLDYSFKLKFIILLWGEKPGDINFPLYTYEETISLGRRKRDEVFTRDATYDPIQPHDIATIVYTSGTTGKPKGVTLTHANIIHQVKYLIQCIQPDPGDRFLSSLPPWHMYERAAEYFIFTRGIEQVYTNVKYLKEDLQAYPCQYLVAVPLIFDTLYSGIQRQISKGSNIRRAFIMGLISISTQYMEFRRIHEGKAIHRAREVPNIFQAFVEWFLAGLLATLLFPLHYIGDKVVYRKIRSTIGIAKAGISAGGNLPIHVDKFFEVMGITLFNGYGLTETSPALATRGLPDNVLGTVGTLLAETEIKIVDLESKKQLQDGEKGIVTVRGTPVMKGYHKNPEATKQVLDDKGWFNTGDIGWLAPKRCIGPARKCGGMLVLEGRAKDTIVLSTGENVEPDEIEEAALKSDLIQQIMVVGQDQRRLGAIIVVNKEVAKLKTNVYDAIRNELKIHLAGCSHQIGPFIIIEEPFTIENGLLTPTMKLRKGVILGHYKEQVKALFSS